MKVDERLKFLLGEKDVNMAIMASQLEEAQDRIKELEKQLEAQNEAPKE